MGTLAQKAPEKVQTKSAPAPRAHAEQIREMSPLQRLQRTMGNQGLQRALQAHMRDTKENAAVKPLVRGDAPVGLQPKLTINTPGDAHEQEADRVADTVMRMADPQHSSPGGEGKRIDGQNSQPAAQIMRAPAGGSGGAVAPPIVHDVLRSPGQPLDAATRAFMEPRFGRDFGRVRVHTDARAAESAAAIDARAYTANRNIVFGSGEYTPTAPKGRDLLAHELAHTVQQGGNEKERHIQRQRLPHETKLQGLDPTSNPAQGFMERQSRLPSQTESYQIRPAAQPDPTAWQTDTLSNGNPAYYKTKAEAVERSHRIGPQWEETEVESFHQAGKTYWRVRMRGTRTVMNFVTLLRKFESSHPGWSKEQVVNSLRRLGGYDDEKFQSFYGTAAAANIVPTPKFTSVDIEQLRLMLHHTTAGPETGIVKDISGQYLAMGHVITGISGGLHRNRSAFPRRWWSAGVGEMMDNLYATTLTGDIGQSAVLANEEFLDRQGTSEWRPTFVGPGTEATDAELVGDIDGLVIGLAFEAADFRAKWDNTKYLSDFLLQYYTSSYKERFQQAAKLDTAYVQDQVTRFAETYEYSQNMLTGAFKRVGPISEAAYRAYQQWLASRIASEAKTETKPKAKTKPKTKTKPAPKTKTKTASEPPPNINIKLPPKF